MATAPLLPTAETPHERAARKHRLIFFGGLAAAVLVVLALIIALTATSGGSDTDGEADAAGDYAVRFLVVSWPPAMARLRMPRLLRVLLVAAHSCATRCSLACAGGRLGAGGEAQPVGGGGADGCGGR